MTKLFTPNAASAYLRERNVPLSTERMRELDGELKPVRIDDGRAGQRAYRQDSLDAFAAGRRAKQGAR